MKVGSITHNRNLSVESKGSKEKANFSDSFNLAHRSKTKEEFAKFNFDGKNMEELNKQIDRYIDYCQEHHLKDVSKLK